MNTVRIAKLNGKYVCTFLDFDYTCQDCKAATKTNPEIICKCRDHMRPLIHNDYALQVSKLLFSNKEAYAKEMLGTVHDNVRPLIDPEDIKVMTETVFDGDYDISEPKYVMVTCDPCGASVQKKNDNTSDYAIVTTFLSGTKIWIGGLDAFKFQTNDAGASVLYAFTAVYNGIRRHPLFKNSTILFVIENNLGLEGPRLQESVCSNPSFYNYVFLRETLDIYGFHTGEQSRLAADLKLQEILATRSIGYIKDIVCVNKTLGRRAADVKRMLSAQIAALMMYERTTCRRGTSAYVTSTYNEEGARINGIHDDLQRALSMGIMVTYMFFGRHLPVDYGYIASLQELSKDYRRDLEKSTKNVMNKVDTIDAYKAYKNVSSAAGDYKKRKFAQQYENLDDDDDDGFLGGGDKSLSASMLKRFSNASGSNKKAKMVENVDFDDE